ncbi:MAG: hypothetical protein Unbinned1473contig1001_9 [Prokaryotic dsDNA virus sp.]|nr:MAG: hypothetical protein Unbinned1473contig1001_9 [Prokaryotic dsDNA virus sp.]
MVDVTVTYGGQQYLVNVPDTFGTLPQEQQRTDIQTLLGKQYPGLNITPPQTQPVDTSFGGAFRYGFDMPLENIAGTMEDFFGVDGSSLRNAIETNPNYRPASADFINPPEDAFTVGGYAPGYLPRAVAEQAGQLGAAMGLRLAGAGAGGAIGTAVAPGAGTTAGAVIGGFSLPTIFEAMQIASPVLRERLKNQGKTIEEATTDDYVIALSTAGFTGLANTFGLLGVGKIKGILTEAVTEGGQSVIQQTGETIATDKGLTIDPKQAVGEGIIGGATRGALDTGISGVKTAAPLTVDAVKSGASKTADAVKAGANVITDPKGAYQDLKTTVKTIPNYRSVNELKNNPRLAESDARVADMFDAEKLKINETRQGTDVAEDVVFKNIQDRLKNTFKEVSEALFKANKITGGDKKVFNQIVSRAAKHNRALTAPIDETTETDINEDISGGFQSDVEFINNLDLDQSDKDTLLDALLDLETVTEAGMKNRSVGALTLLIRRFGSGAGASAGAMLGGGVGAAVGATAVPKSFEAIAQRIDSFLKLNRPKVLKRVEQRRKAAELIGRDYGNTPKDLADLIQRLLEQQVAVNTKQDKQTVDPEVQKLTDYLNEIGAPRAGGWLETVRQYVQKAVEGFGVAVTQEDILATIARLQEIGMLSQETADDLALNRGGQITIPKLMQLLTDATLASVRERAGIKPDPEAQADANAAAQNAQSRRDARIQQGIEDNRRVLDASKTALEANNKIPKADKAKLSVALENMRLDLGRNPVEAIQNIVKDLRKSGVDEASIQAYILPYATRVAQQQQQNDVVFSQVDPIPEVETAPASNPNRISTSRTEAARDPIDSFNEERQISVSLFEDNPTVFDKIYNKVRSTVIGMGKLAKDNKQFAIDYKNHIKDNLRFLYEQTLPEYRERAKQWYVGANKLAQGLADQYNLKLEQSAAVLAALSPQLDWFLNYELGRRVIDIHETQQDTVFEGAVWDAAQDYVNDMKDKTKRNKIDKANAQDIIDSGKGKPLRDLNAMEAAYFIRFYNEVNQNQVINIITPEGDVGDLQMNDDGVTPTTGGWNSGFAMIAKGVKVLRDPSRLTIHYSLGEKHKVRSFYNNILDPNSLMGDVTIDTHAVAAALLRPLSGNSLPVAHNFKDAGTSAVLGVFGSYAVYADAYRELADELGILPRELQSITWEAARGLFPQKKKQDKTYRDNLEQIWQDVDSGKITADEARSIIYDTAGGIDRADWEDTKTQPGNAERPSDIVSSRVQQTPDPTELPLTRVSGDGDVSGVDVEPSGVLRRPTEEVNQQLELDFDVNSIPTPTTTDGQAAREIKENLEEAEALIEIGKPGSIYEDGIKTYDQLNALLTALNLASNFHVVDSREDFDKLVDAYGSKINEETREGTMGVTIQNQTDGSKAIIVMRQGRGGDRIQDREFLTILHEIAHAIEFQNRYQGNDPQIGFSKQPVLRPYNTRSFEGSATPNQKLAFHPMYDVSLRGLLNSYLNSLVPREVSVSSKILETDTEAFNNDPIVKEIRQIQADENITVPEGQSGRIRPFLSDKDYGQVYDTAEAIAATRGEEPILTRDEFLSEKRPLITKQRETYTETAPEFTVDPVLFSLAEPKIAKKKYPNIYKFIQDVMNGKTPDVLKNTRFNNIRRDTNIKLYTAPFSVILAAVLSAMGMAEDEEEMPPVSPPNRGALTPQPGALSI